MVLYKTYLFYRNLLIWLVTMATKRQNLRKNIQKINSSEAVWGIKLKRCRIICNTNLFKKIVFIAVFKHFGRYGNLKFPLTYNGKSENWDLLLSHCRYFDKSVTEMFLEYSPLQTIWFCPNRWFCLVAMATEMLNFRKQYSKIFFSEVMRGMKLKLCINVYVIILHINCVFFFFFFFFFLLLFLMWFRCYGNFKFP